MNPTCLIYLDLSWCKWPYYKRNCIQIIRFTILGPLWMAFLQKGNNFLCKYKSPSLFLQWMLGSYIFFLWQFIFMNVYVRTTKRTKKRKDTKNEVYLPSSDNSSPAPAGLFVYPSPLSHWNNPYHIFGACQANADRFIGSLGVLCQMTISNLNSTGSPIRQNGLDTKGRNLWQLGCWYTVLINWCIDHCHQFSELFFINIRMNRGREDNEEDNDLSFFPYGMC
jgi:hypothetical protein